MDELYKDINRWIREQKEIQEDDEIKQLADILVDGFISQEKDKPIVEEERDQKQEGDLQ